MSNKMRYRRGDTKPVFVTPDSTVAIEIGDLLFRHPTSKKALPASAFPWQGTEYLTQDWFQTYFLGVAEQASPVGGTDPIRVATEGEFEFECASATFGVGDYVGGSKGSGNALEDQTVEAVTTPTLAIGRVAQEGTSVTGVLVRILSTIMGSGLQNVETSSSGSSSGF